MNTEFNGSEFSADAGKDPDRLEREIDEQRREINETLRALEEKFSSRELAGQFMQYFGGPSREWAATLAHSVRANPIPTLLTAIGVTWLMMSDRHGAQRSSYAYASTGYEGQGSDRFEGAASSVHDATDSMMRKAHELGDKAEHAGAALGEKTAHAREALGEKAAHAREALRDRAMHAREGLAHAREGLSHAREGLHHSTVDLRDNFGHMLKEQPLALGAVGIALGALIGAALPRTEHERRTLGEVSERVMEKGKEMAMEGYEKASEKVSDVVAAAEGSLQDGMSGVEGDIGPADDGSMQAASSTSQGPRAPVPGGPGLG